jgi:hypothetical protein
MSEHDPLMEFVTRANQASRAVHAILRENSWTEASLNKAEAIVDDLEVLAVTQAIRLFTSRYHRPPTRAELTQWARETYRPVLADFLASSGNNRRVSELLTPPREDDDDALSLE